MTDNKKFFDINTGATIIGVSPMTIRRAIKANKITFKLVMENYQKKYLITYEDLEAYITTSANNGTYGLEKIKEMKDRLEDHKAHRSVGNKTDNSVTQNENNDLYNFIKDFVDTKINQYENKISHQEEILQATRTQANQYQLQYTEANTKLEMVQKNNNDLKNELHILHDILSKCEINSPIQQNNKVIYMDIISYK